MRGFALAAAIAASAFLPGERLGVAVPVVAALMLAAVGAALRVGVLRVAFAVLALALASQAALLDATWVVSLDLVAAWILASLAASGLSLQALTAPALRLRQAPLAPRPSERQVPALRGVGLAAIVVLPFVLLFVSADAAFASLAGNLPLPSGASLPGRIAILALVLAATLGLGLAARTPSTAWRQLPARRLSCAEWAIPLALLDLLFIAFVVVQLAVLFGGHERVLETAGLTYAEYARAGFWQLLAATALTVAVVGAALAYAHTRGGRERLLLHVLLGGFCALTFVVLLSALQRLRLYEEAFGLTRARLVAEALALWFGVLLLLLAAAALVHRARKRLAPAAVLATSLGLLVLSLADPDRRVAERNVDRWRQTGHIDLAYLSGLSADAAPALVALPSEKRAVALAGIRRRLAEHEPWSSANRSRRRARALLG